MFRVPRTHEEWLEASAFKRLGSDPVFATCRERNPLVARFWLGFCRYYDSGFEAFERGEVQASKECSACMKELFSWCSDGEHRPDESPAETIERMIREGFSLPTAFELNTKLRQRGRGRPVSTRWPALLAYERKLQDPSLTYKQLVVDFCRCGKSKHLPNCEQNLRQQIIAVRRVIGRLGV